eukprot:744921-Pyramimonas_sp.AAC.1
MPADVKVHGRRARPEPNGHAQGLPRDQNLRGDPRRGTRVKGAEAGRKGDHATGVLVVVSKRGACDKRHARAIPKHRPPQLARHETLASQLKPLASYMDERKR